MSVFSKNSNIFRKMKCNRLLVISRAPIEFIEIIGGVVFKVSFDCEDFGIYLFSNYEKFFEP